MLAESPFISPQSLLAVGTFVIEEVGNQAGKHNNRTDDGTYKSKQISGQHDDEANHHQCVSQCSRFFVIHIVPPSYSTLTSSFYSQKIAKFYIQFITYRAWLQSAKIVDVVAGVW